MPDTYGIAELKERIGEELAVTDWLARRRRLREEPLEQRGPAGADVARLLGLNAFSQAK